MEGIDKNTFKKIFNDHWDAFKQAHPRFDCPNYNDTIQKMLNCGDPKKMGFAQYRCCSGVKLDIGNIIVLQTAGRSGHYNPHLHILMTAGGIDPQEHWKNISYIRKVPMNCILLHYRILYRHRN